MTNEEVKSIIESLLFVVGDEGIDLKRLVEAISVEEALVVESINELQTEYADRERGFQIVYLGGSYQLTTNSKNAPYIEKMVEDPKNHSISQAALETLAIIAYKQPITRVEVEEIRGVKTDKPLQTLMSKLLIKEVGRAEKTGRAILYGTTREFLFHFGLSTIEDLPPLPDGQDKGEDDEADLFFEKFQEIPE
ncbi:SMC-Scp complex subunit ScpB [Guptibacillus algicola]|uniref:SMC-Scp complex subunit ScpB n=1 Tax=Guptibacillus algicola TaxID=225844 RepID=UPI001CD3B49A|nr:SMC-Scp complex subunit ScpB [Alkalihalobacillus algicola]MCA0985842.1 SMC-Scp complex subunit ScpB [Alkalihalobacillus algicola]